MSTTKSSADCVPGAIPGGLVRTSFFNGMFLTQSDLETEQRFWRMKRRLTNRALGQGVVWGLRVAFDSGKQKLTVGPGYGLDCCGNDLVVQAAHDVRASELLELADSDVKKLLTEEKNEVALLLEYVECADDLRPVHKDACSPTADSCEPARRRESARLTLAPVAKPAPSPIGKFVEQLRSAPSLQVIEEMLPQLPVPFLVRARFGTGELLSNRTEAEGEIGDVFTYSGNPPRISIGFELVPDAGWVFHRGEVWAGDEMIAQVKAPFDVRLAWDYVLDVSRDNQQAKLSFEIKNLEVSELFGRQRLRAAEFSVDALADQAKEESFGDVRTCHVCLEKVRFAKAPEMSRLSSLHDGDCLDPLSGLVFLDGLKRVGDAPKTILLATLYAWLTSQFGHADGFPAGDPPDPDEMNGQRVLASWLYLIAWKVLFGEDAAGDDQKERERLAALLDTLMAEWCAGFFYAGPRCPSEGHGAVLGTLTLGKNGKILAFDPWKGRRFVLTGPLLTHWGAQLGLAPIDVVAGRLVSTICCLGLGKSENGVKASMALPALGKNGGTMLSDGVELFFAEPGKIDLPVTGEENVVSWPKFVMRLLDALSADLPTTAPTTYEVYRVDGLGDGMQPLLYVATTPHVAGAREEVRAAVRVVVEEIMESYLERSSGPLLGGANVVRFEPHEVPVVLDLLTELAFDVPLAILDGFSDADLSPGDQTNVRSFLRDLMKKGVITVADALALGVEGLLALAPEDVKVEAAAMSIWRIIATLGKRSLFTAAIAGVRTGIAAVEGPNNNKKRWFRRKHVVVGELLEPLIKELSGWAGVDLKHQATCAAMRTAILPTTPQL